jgi:capsular exopolysaccharide synthesis family protein
MSVLLGLNPKSSARPASVARPVSSEKRIAINPDPKSRLVFLTEPEGLAVERYRLIRRRLSTLHPNGAVVLVTSPSAGEGKTLTSINLAWSFAEAGHSSCLVDLDFRAPGLSRTLRHRFEEDGVQEVLEGRSKIGEVICRLGEQSLYVLGIKRRLTSPGYLFYSAAMGTMVAELRTTFKWVILDFSPVIPMADFSEMIPHIDGAILVVRTGKTEKDTLKAAIEAVGGKLWGVVANDCPITGGAYYGSYGKVVR